MIRRKEQNNAQTNASCPKMLGVQMQKHFAYNKIHAISFSYLQVYDSEYKEDETVKNVHCTQFRLILISHWERHKWLKERIHLHNKQNKFRSTSYSIFSCLLFLRRVRILIQQLVGGYIAFNFKKHIFIGQNIKK